MLVAAVKSHIYQKLHIVLLLEDCVALVLKWDSCNIPGVHTKNRKLGVQDSF